MLERWPCHTALCALIHCGDTLHTSPSLHKSAMMRKFGITKYLRTLDDKGGKLTFYPHAQSLKSFLHLPPIRDVKIRRCVVTCDPFDAVLCLPRCTPKQTLSYNSRILANILDRIFAGMRLLLDIVCLGCNSVYERSHPCECSRQNLRTGIRQDATRIWES